MFCCCLVTLLMLVQLLECPFSSRLRDFPGGSDGKASVYNAGDPGSITGWGRFPGEGNGNPLQYSCLENPIDGGARRLQPWGHKESDTTERLNFHFHFVPFNFWPSFKTSSDDSPSCGMP